MCNKKGREGLSKHATYLHWRMCASAQLLRLLNASAPAALTACVCLPSIQSTIPPTWLVRVCAAGSYACVDVGKVFQPLSMPGKAGFATTSQRFKLATATPDTVGPCTYQQQQSSLVKPTFNVTLDQ